MTILAGTAGLKSPAVVESADNWSGVLASGLAGAAAAIAVAIVLTLYFRGQYRSPRNIARDLAGACVAISPSLALRVEAWSRLVARTRCAAEPSSGARPPCRTTGGQPTTRDWGDKS